MQTKNKIALKKILDTNNIVDLLDKEDYATLSNLVADGYDKDRQDQRPWLEKVKKYLKLADCDVSQRSTPWAGAANACLPLLANICITAASRLYVELLQQKYPVEVAVLPVPAPQQDPNQPQQEIDPNAMNLGTADIIKEHMMYQLKLNQNCNWEEDLYTLCYLFYTTGTVARYKHYDKKLGAYIFKTLWPQDWCASHDAVTDISNMRFSFRKNYYIHEVMEHINSGKFSHYKYLEDMINSKNSKMDLYESRKFIKQFVKLDLDHDGYAEPYCIEMDYEARQIVRITKNFYYEDTEREVEEGNVFENWEQEPVEEAQEASGNNGSSSFEYDNKGNIISVNYLETIPYVSIYKMYEGQRDSFYKDGISRNVYSLNRGANALINQILDIGTLQARQGVFIDQRARLPGGTRVVSMNESIFVKPPPGLTLRDAISPFPQNPISPIQFQLVELFKSVSDESAQVTELMAGQVPDNTSPVIGLSAIQNSLLPFKTGYRLFLKGYSRELQAIAKMNYIYIDKEEFTSMNNMQLMVTREMYANVAITPTADPIMSSEAERLGQQMVLDGVLQYDQVDKVAILRRKLKTINIDHPEIYVPDPVPPDPNAPALQQQTATVEALKAQAQQAMGNVSNDAAKIQLERDKFEFNKLHDTKQLALKADEVGASNTLREANTIKSLAIADSTTKNTDIKKFQAVTDIIKHGQNKKIASLDIEAQSIPTDNMQMQLPMDSQDTGLPEGHVPPPSPYQ